MSDYMPLEVILEVLKRLPVKSVVKCRSVCKTWNSLINNPSFISSHLQTALSKSNTPLLLLRLLRNDKENYILHFDNDDFDEFKQLLFPFNSDPYRLVGSCNGLICLHYGFFRDYDELVIWNPSIQKYFTLPYLNITYFGESIYNIALGFGFDSRTSDYKLLKLVCMLEKGEFLTEGYLFSLNRNSWKKVNATFHSYDIEGRGFHNHYGIEGQGFAAFVNGVLHWLGYEKGKDGEFRNMVLGLDASTEELFVMSLPECLVGLCPMDLSIMKYEESSIAVLRRDWEDSELLDLWVMKEYGAVGSWTKVLHLTDHSGELPMVLGFRKNGEVLLEVGRGQLASMDLKCLQMEDLEVKAEPGILVFDKYVESLVLLDNGVDAGGVNYANHVQ